MTMNMLGSLLFLLAVPQCFFSFPTTFAFAKIPASHLLPQGRHPMPASPLIPSAASVRGGANPEKSVEEIQDAALGNIKACYRNAFAAGVVGTASVVWESYQRTGQLAGSSPRERAALFSHLFQFVFSAGLMQAWSIFARSRGPDRMSPPNMQKLCQTLGRLWLGSMVCLSVEWICIAEDLKLSAHWVGAAALLFVGNLPLGDWFHRRALMSEEKSPGAAAEYEPARQAGFGAARNMIWMVGSIAAGSIVEMTMYTVQTMRAEGLQDKAGVIVGGFLGVSESFVMIALLSSLYRTFLRNVLVSTNANFSSKGTAFKEYYQAQSKFYGRVSSFFGFQAFFTVLGYLAQVAEKLWK